MRSEIGEIPRVFEEIISHSSEISDSVTLLRTRKIYSVLILARGTSDNAAHFLKYLIETQLGLPVGLTSPSSVTIYNTKLRFDGTLVIALSQSGQSPDLVAYAQSAKSSGALVISMTNDDASPLALIGDAHLSLHAGPELAVAASKSYAAELLCSYLLVRAWQGVEHRAEQLPAIVRENLKVNIDGAVTHSNLENEIVILGRGFSYPNAREAALKIQETCKVSVQGLSTADYLHGPISALEANTIVMFMSPRHAPVESMQAAIDRVRSVGSTILWCGGGAIPLPGEIVIGDSTIQVENEILASIADAALLQRFALELCIQHGLDPDKPVGLTKVTLTR